METHEIDPEFPLDGHEKRISETGRLEYADCQRFIANKVAFRRQERGFFGRLADNWARFWSYRPVRSPVSDGKLKDSLRSEMRAAMERAGITLFDV